MLHPLLGDSAQTLCFPHAEIALRRFLRACTEQFDLLLTVNLSKCLHCSGWSESKCAGGLGHSSFASQKAATPPRPRLLRRRLRGLRLSSPPPRSKNNSRSDILSELLCFMRRGGLEPPSLAAYAPQAYAYTSSATCAYKKYIVCGIGYQVRVQNFMSP